VAQTDGILIGTFSDPYNDVRYYGEIKFLFPASTALPPRRYGLFALPIKVARFGVKDIFFYKDMKVTFNNGKVSNVE